MYRILIGPLAAAIFFMGFAGAKAEEVNFQPDDRGIVTTDLRVSILQPYDDLIVGQSCWIREGGRVAFQTENDSRVAVSYYHPLGQVNKNDCPGSSDEVLYVSVPGGFFVAMKNFADDRAAFKTVFEQAGEGVAVAAQ